MGEEGEIETHREGVTEPERRKEKNRNLVGNTRNRVGGKRARWRVWGSRSQDSGDIPALGSEGGARTSWWEGPELV